MNRMTHLQLFFGLLIIGFLAGPRAMEALNRIGTPNAPESANISQIAAVGSAHTIDELTQPQPKDAFADLQLTGKAVFVWDITTHRKLFGYNEYASLPLASVTKMMTALIATELATPEATIAITGEDIKEEGDTGLFAGEEWRLKDLLDFTLVASSNDGASAIARASGSVLSSNASSTDPMTSKKLFIAKMNEKAHLIGLDNTRFVNESGLDVTNDENGGHGSARDMAVLFEYIFKKYPELLTATTQATLKVHSLSKFIHNIANTNIDVASTTGIIGSKTGYTDLAGGNLVILVDIGINHPVAIAVLGSTREGRFADVEQLIKAATEQITTEITSQ